MKNNFKHFDDACMRDVPLSRSLQHRTQFLKDLAGAKVPETATREELAQALLVLAEGAGILLQGGAVYPSNVDMDSPEQFWPVAAGQSRKELVALIGRMNFELTRLRGDTEALSRKLQGQRQALANLQGESLDG